LENKTWEKIERKIVECAENVVCKECGAEAVKIFLNRKNLEELRGAYEMHRKRIHTQMYKNEVPIPQENFGQIIVGYDDRIDRHKIAAALIAAIIEVEPMQMGARIEDPSPKTRTANELLAYIVGIYVIEQMLNAQRNFKHKITPPKCSTDESYQDHFVRVLYRIKKLSKDKILETAIAFLMSNALFLFEKCSIEMPAQQLSAVVPQP